MERDAVEAARLGAVELFEERGVGFPLVDRASRGIEFDLLLFHLLARLLEHAAEEMREPLFGERRDAIDLMDQLRVAVEEDEPRLDELEEIDAVRLMKGGVALEPQRHEALAEELDDAGHHERPREHVLFEDEPGGPTRTFAPRGPPPDRTLG